MAGIASALPWQLSVFLLDYGQSNIREAASNEEITPSVGIASNRETDSHAGSAG
jgi:hypothetical protein